MYVCPKCGHTSAHPDDERYGYCDVCKAFTRPATKATEATKVTTARAKRRSVDTRRRPGPVDDPPSVERAPDEGDV